MLLLIREGNYVKPSDIALTIPEFKAVIEERGGDIDKAIFDFTYIESMVSPSKNNPYNNYSTNYNIELEHELEMIYGLQENTLSRSTPNNDGFNLLELLESGEALTIDDINSDTDLVQQDDGEVHYKELLFKYVCNNRHFKIVDKTMKDKNYLPNKIILNALILYKEFMDSIRSVRLLRSAESAVDKTIEFLETFDYSSSTNAGAAKYKPSDIQRALTGMKESVASLKELEKEVYEYVISRRKTTADRAINYFEKRPENRI